MTKYELILLMMIMDVSSIGYAQITMQTDTHISSVPTHSDQLNNPETGYNRKTGENNKNLTRKRHKRGNSCYSCFSRWQ